MGYMSHHAICVTGWQDDVVATARAKALDIFKESQCIVTEVTSKVTNGYQSFFIAPDGSKEGWSASDDGDECRDLFIRYLNSTRHEDRSSRLDWVLVQYGDDEGQSVVVRHSDEDSDD